MKSKKPDTILRSFGRFKGESLHIWHFGPSLNFGLWLPGFECNGWGTKANWPSWNFFGIGKYLWHLGPGKGEKARRKTENWKARRPTLTPLISHHSSHSTHLTALISHHSSHTTHLTALISQHSSYTTHLTALISHHSSHTTHLTAVISHHSSHTTHLTALISHHSSHTTHLTALISQHSSLTTHLIPNAYSGERHKTSHVGLSGPFILTPKTSNKNRSTSLPSDHRMASRRTAAKSSLPTCCPTWPPSASFQASPSPRPRAVRKLISKSWAKPWPERLGNPWETHGKAMGNQWNMHQEYQEST